MMRGVGLATDDGLWWQGLLGAVEVATANTDVDDRPTFAELGDKEVSVCGCLAFATLS